MYRFNYVDYFYLMILKKLFIKLDIFVFLLEICKVELSVLNKLTKDLVTNISVSYNVIIVGFNSPNPNYLYTV